MAKPGQPFLKNLGLLAAIAPMAIDNYQVAWQNCVSHSEDPARWIPWNQVGLDTDLVEKSMRLFQRQTRPAFRFKGIECSISQTV